MTGKHRSAHAGASVMAYLRKELYALQPFLVRRFDFLHGLMQVAAPGYDPVITHIFAPDCQYLAEDAVFGVKDELIGDLQRVTDEDQAKALGLEAPAWLIDWDFNLVPQSAARTPAAQTAII